MNELILALVILSLAAVAFGAYLVAFIRGDGVRFERRQPPPSRYPDHFDPVAGPRQFA